MATQRILQLGTNGKPTDYVPIVVSTGAASSGHVIAANASGQVDPSFLAATVVVSAGAADATKTVTSNASGKLDNTLLPYAQIAASAGAGDAGKMLLSNGSGKVDTTLLPYLQINASAGVGDAGKMLLSNAAGKIDTTLLPYAQVTASAGASDAGKMMLLNGSGKLDSTFLPTGIGADTAAMVASEALGAGALVSVWSNAGVQNARNADGATTNKEACGFVLAAVLSGGTATVYFAGQIVGLTGVVPGPVFLSDTTPGSFTATAPTAAGHIAQQVGTGISTTSIDFGKYAAYTRA